MSFEVLCAWSSELMVGKWWTLQERWEGSFISDWKEVTQWVKYLPARQETQETWVQSLGQKDPREEEMAAHSTRLPWRSPWTEEPDRLQSTGLQRVGHKWSYRARPRTIWSCTLGLILAENSAAVRPVTCQEAFNRRLPVWCFGSVRNPLFLINSWIFRN